MSDGGPPDLLRGTVADLRTLMSHPPKMRRGFSQLVSPAAVAAGANWTYTVGTSFYERILGFYAQFVAASAAGLRSLTINLLNPDGAVFNITPCVSQIGPSETWTVSADIFNTSGQPTAGGVAVSGSVTATTAGEVIATTGPLPAGRYTVQGQFKLGGTTAAIDANNAQVQVGATVIQVLYNGSGSPSLYSFGPFTVDVPANTAITVNVIAAGTSTAQYAADLEVSDVSAFASYPQLPDLVLLPGWALQLAIGNVQTGDQLSGMQILVERYASNMASGQLEHDEERWLHHHWW